MSETRWPHKMERGILKGRTFSSQAAYMRALHEAQERQENGHTPEIRKLIDAYEVLVSRGLGRNAAIEIVEDIVEMVQ